MGAGAGAGAGAEPGGGRGRSTDGTLKTHTLRSSPAETTASPGQNGSMHRGASAWPRSLINEVPSRASHALIIPSAEHATSFN